jgi:hypothetical protein
MDLDLFNARLADQFGRDLTGRPRFRIIWSQFQTEKRYGHFVDYVPGTNILVREVDEVREVRKYPYLDPQWVLERLAETEPYPEAVCRYEPFWTFGYETDGRAKEPVWRAIEFLIDANRNPEVLSPQQMQDAEEDEMRREDEMMREFIDASVRNDPLHSSVRDGDTVMLNDATRKTCLPQ